MFKLLGLNKEKQLFHMKINFPSGVHPNTQRWVIKHLIGASSHDTLCSTAELTIADGSPGDLPQHQAEGPNVHSLVRLKAVRLDGVVQHLRGHVALGAHFGVVAHIQLISVLEVHNSQACGDKRGSRICI